jgi:hypothetical protein
MKNTSDSQAWVPIVAGAIGLLAVGIAFRQCGSSPSPESVNEPKLAAKARLGDNERGGWIAQSQRRTGRSTGEGGGAAGGRMADSAAPSRSDRGAERGELAPPFRGGVSGHDAGERDFRDTDTVDAGGEKIAAQPHLSPANAAAPPVGAGEAGAGVTAGAGITNVAGNPAGNPAAGAARAAKPGTDTTGTAPTEQVAEAKPPVQADAADVNGPVFSLPLDKSTQPDKGDTSPIIADGVTFDQNGARFSANSQIFIPNGGNVDPSAGTITFWTLPDWAGETTGDAHYVHLGADTFENHIDFFKNNRYMRFLFADNSGYEAGGGRDVAGWKPGDRHMITGTWGDGVTVLYLDGEWVDAHDYAGDLVLGPNPPLILGTASPGLKTGANSNISGFQIYARALSADEVAGLFAQGPP